MEFVSRRLLLSASSAAVLATMAFAANSAMAQAAKPDQIEEVVVTGTRIVRNGYSAPTPVSVVTPQQLESSATGNIADYVNQIPAFFGSTTPQSTNHGSSGATAGLNALNLRNLGTTRTLVLLDGQRSVGSNTAGAVDINAIPQDLVTRVDIVTGGASAAYGSDAIAGVVNFVLDRTYVGTKIDISAGVTSYGDDYQSKIRLTYGSAFAGGRGHLILSGETSNNNGIHGVPRAWEYTGFQQIANPQYVAKNGLPQFLVVPQTNLWQATYGGVITRGPLAGTMFGPGGTPSVIQFGGIVSNPYETGGDWKALTNNDKNSLDPSQVSNRFFARAQYDVTDNFDVWAQYSWAGTRNWNVNEPIFNVDNLTIKTDNAFIPASIATRIAPLKITSLTMGTLNGDLPPWQNSVYRQTRRIVLGADGKFNALDNDWSWNAYYQEGMTFTNFTDPGDLNVVNYNLAIDAVTNPATGQIQCRSTATTSPNNGCVPYNIFGIGVNTAAAVNYVEGAGNVATQKLGMEEQVWSAALNGEPFSLPAGRVSFATGVEHRTEAVNVTADKLTGQWYGANYTPVKGHYTVTEGFIETVVPVVRDAWFAKSLDVNAAVRATGYSLAGFVATWKLGFTWDVIPDIRFRGTRSRDIRAPNLGELFQTGAGGTNTRQDDFHNNNNVLNTGVTTGNTNLRPETSNSTGVGFVFQPTFFDNFNFSADFWQDDIKSAISSIGGQQVIDLCFQGFKQYCSQMTPDLSTLSATPASIVIVTQPVNLASQRAEGIDFESDYHFELADVVAGWPGSVAIRYVGTHYITNSTNNNLVPPLQIVGSTLPKWRHNLSVSYTGNPFSVSLTARITSAGVLNDNFVQCITSCPLSTTNNPTYNYNYAPGSMYFDTSMNYNFEGPYDTSMQIYMNVQNIMNKSPPPIPAAIGFAPSIATSTNGAYDLLGRTFRLGIRLNT